MQILLVRQHREKVRRDMVHFVKITHTCSTPYSGIVVTVWAFGLSGAKYIVWRHLRVRVGKESGATLDGIGEFWFVRYPLFLTDPSIGMRGSNFAIFDYFSVSWTIDESFVSLFGQIRAYELTRRIVLS